MITKEELKKMLDVSIRAAYELEGQIKLLRDQIRIVILKEAELLKKEQEKKDKEE